MDLKTYINSKSSIESLPVVYFDLDGTLVNMDKIEPECIEFIHLFKKLGIPVGIATGRSYMEAAHHIKAIEPSLPCVLCDGQLIYDNIADTYTSMLEYPFDEYRKLRTLMKDDLLFVDEYYDHYQTESRKASRLFCLSMKVKPCEFQQEYKEKDQIAGFAASLNRSPSNAVMKELQHRIEHSTLELKQLDYNCYGTYWIKFSAKNVMEISKASAVLNIIKSHSFHNVQLWYFGDGSNDIELMNMAGIKIIMQKADTELKKVRNGFVLESSISDAMKEIYLLLAKRYL